MFKITLSLIFITVVSVSAITFGGSWIVEDEGITLSFFGEDSISLISDDESVSGVGNYIYTDTTITAEIKSSDMNIKIKYNYKESGDTIMVKTDLMKINGEITEASDEWFRLVKKEEPSAEKEDKK